MPRLFYASSPLLLLHTFGEKGYRTNVGSNRKIANNLAWNYGSFIIYQIHWKQCFGHVFGKKAEFKFLVQQLNQIINYLHKPANLNIPLNPKTQASYWQQRVWMNFSQVWVLFLGNIDFCYLVFIFENMKKCFQLETKSAGTNFY